MDTRQTFFFWKDVSDKVALCRVYSSLLELSFFPVHYIKIQPSGTSIQVGQKEMKITQYANDTTVSGARSRFRFAVAEALKQFY